MTFTELYQKYFTVIWSAFEYDIGVFSQMWIYYWCFVPALFYFVFFLIKWSVLTAPLWLPVTLFLQSSSKITDYIRR